MNMNEYQNKARKTAIYPDSSKIIYPALGLAGEAGETCDKIKKVIRDHQGHFNPEESIKIADELGDVMWYVANLAHDLGYNLEDIAKQNIQKLESRQARNKLQGSGDNR